MTRLRDAGLLWPTIFALPALAILITLGAWQWERMHWKAGLLSNLEAARAAPPVGLGELFGAAPGDAGTDGLEALRFRQVRLRVHGPMLARFFVWNPQPGGPAWSVVTAWKLADEVAGYDHALVIMGWVPEKDRTALRSVEREALNSEISGRVRLDAPNPSAPAPVLARDEWFTRDLRAMAEQVAARQARPGRFLPFFIERSGTVPPPLKPNNATIMLSNRHLEYAMTWWGLALTLVGAYAAFAWSRLRRAA